MIRKRFSIPEAPGRQGQEERGYPDGEMLAERTLAEWDRFLFDLHPRIGRSEGDGSSGWDTKEYRAYEIRSSRLYCVSLSLREAHGKEMAIVSLGRTKLMFHDSWRAAAEHFASIVREKMPR